jgi:hypothetical protein
MSATRDLRSNIASDLHYYNEILSDGTSSGAILDTADYDSGIMFNFGVVDYGDGTYTVTIYESDDSGMSTSNPISSTSLIGSTSDLIFTSATGQGNPMNNVGGVTTGAILYIGINKKHEILPVV